ncbi:MAG: cadmium-translocating P-type ATPase [Lachnospira sp.]|nr:cadmium-translocating P-type ATPase [Lachnospira sp.]
MSKKHKKVLYRIIISLLLFVIVSLLPTAGWVRLISFLVPYLIVGYDVLKKALGNIFHGRLFDENFLMALATVGAFIIAEYAEGVAVMLFYQVGELFQSIAVGKSRKSIAALMDIKPESANVYRDGELVEVFPEDLLIGEIVLVKPGEKVPVDGSIVEGTTSVSTLALTGESLPCDKKTGESIISGTINLTSAIKVKVESLYEDSTVAKILDLVENSYDKKAKVDNFISRFAKYYTPFVVIAALLLAVLGPIISGGNISEWVSRALIFLVVSCPCALVISVPLSFFAGIGCASRKGVLIKGSNYLEALSQIDTIVFDKTGTLTKGNFKVVEINPTNISKEALLEYAAYVESYSNHPIAESIVREYGKDAPSLNVSDVKEIAGQGISALVDGKRIYAGNEKLMKGINVAYERPSKEGSVVYVVMDEKYLGNIIIADEIKEDSKNAIDMLKNISIKDIVMLTGDKREVANEIGNSLGIKNIFAELLPNQKVEKVEELLSNGAKLAFAGDGINDAPVLARADVGIAMGAMGSDAAIEAADVVLMDDNPTKIATAVRISKKTMRIVKQNIWFALITKGLVMVLGAMGMANMWFAVFADVGVMVIAILNAMRTMKI